MLKFTKMQGAGNDYIYFNCFTQNIEDPNALALKVSDRHFGIGGDGIVMICKSDVADAKMRMFNIDGSEGKMCGNAIRCVAKYLHDYMGVNKEVVTIDTLSGIKTLKLHTENGKVNYVDVDMGKAEFTAKLVPVVSNNEKCINEEIEILGVKYQMTCVSMGNPHCVVYVDDVANFDIETIGTAFENHPAFPERVNTEFIQLVDSHNIKMRVWERGSGETLACGTGACGSVAASVINGHCAYGEDVKVELIGGDLYINYTDETVIMKGPAVAVFDGEIEE